MSVAPSRAELVTLTTKLALSCLWCSSSTQMASLTTSSCGSEQRQMPPQQHSPRQARRSFCLRMQCSSSGDSGWAAAVQGECTFAKRNVTIYCTKMSALRAQGHAHHGWPAIALCAHGGMLKAGGVCIRVLALAAAAAGAPSWTAPMAAMAALSARHSCAPGGGGVSSMRQAQQHGEQQQVGARAACADVDRRKRRGRARLLALQHTWSAQVPGARSGGHVVCPLAASSSRAGRETAVSLSSACACAACMRALRAAVAASAQPAPSGGPRSPERPEMHSWPASRLLRGLWRAATAIADRETALRAVRAAQAARMA